MKPQQITYDICRHYLSDHRSTLPEHVYNYLLGSLRARNLDALASCTTRFQPNIVGRESYRVLMQVEAFFKKNVSFSAPDRCRTAAMSSFNRGERICRITNRRLDHYYFHTDRLDPCLEEQLSRMTKVINKCLGPYENFLEQLPKLVRVTAGATSTKSRRQAIPYLRISKKPYATRRASPYLHALSHHYGYGNVKVREVSTNRVEFVPKNWKTDRTIACEPEGNMFLQLAFDSFVKRRLKRIGVNLNSQFKNQVLAKEGSISGSHATVDLSMASDTLAFNTVAWMLPHPWFDFVRNVRSPKARGSVECEYAKFSSMGNGCTFALETLVFTAAVIAVGSKDYAVYGDDIVIETEYVKSLMRLLRFLGFIPNDAKTHTMGPFRESCGANWYEGIDITPKYLREMDDRKATICHVVNSLMTITCPGEGLWEYLLALTSKLRLPLTPYSSQTTAGVFITEHHARKRKLLRQENWILKAKAYTSVSYRKSVHDSRALFLWHLDATRWGSRGAHDSVVRSRYSISSHRYRRKWVHWVSDPVAGAPLQLESWSERLMAISNLH